MDQLNTHFYDGKIAELKKPFQDELTRIRSLPKEEKLTAFQILKEHLPKEAHANLDMIVNDLGTVANYDSKNDLYADDLLYFCYFIAKEDWDSNVLAQISTQLVEMSLGKCAQGRTLRLFQIVWSLHKIDDQVSS